MIEDEEMLEGETVEFDGEDVADVEDTEDGGAIVTLDENGPAARASSTTTSPRLCLNRT